MDTGECLRVFRGHQRGVFSFMYVPVDDDDDDEDDNDSNQNNKEEVSYSCLARTHSSDVLRDVAVVFVSRIKYW